METSKFWIIILLNALHQNGCTNNESQTIDFRNETQEFTTISILPNNKKNLAKRIVNYNPLELNQLCCNNEVIEPNPTSIEVRSDSILYSDAGQEVVINFEVTNNQNKLVPYIFEGTTEDNNEVYITPPRLSIFPFSKILVKARFFPNYSKGPYKGLLTFRAKWFSGRLEEQVSQEVYYYIGTQKPDTTGPTIYYSFNGDCSGYFHPRNCHNKIWRAEISIQDRDSGLLSIVSNPIGVVLNKRFIIGTTEEVSGYYRANCCQTKVDVTAADISGNENTIYIDIEKKWLSTGEVTAIILGVILLLIFIITIITCIIYLCRRKRRTLSIYPETSGI